MEPTLQNTLVSSWGGQFDTCYVTQEEADAYLAGKEAFPQWQGLWSGLGSIAKASILIQATNQIDGAYNWFNDKFFYWQTLQFPRYTNIYGWFPSTATPDAAYYDYISQDIEQRDMRIRIKKACCEQAFWILRQGGYSEDLERQQLGIKSYSESIGPIHEAASYKESAGPLCREAFSFMRAYVSQPKLVRG